MQALLGNQAFFPLAIRKVAYATVSMALTGIRQRASLSAKLSQQ
jgi:hypothetical protein